MTRKRIFIIVIAFSLFGFLAWWNIGTKAVDLNDKSNKIFVVRNGAGIKEISTNLKQAGLIKDQIIFFLLVKYLQLDSKIQKGDFRLSASMDAKMIAESLTHGSLDSWITIPEGKRSEEIADMLQSRISSYDESWRTLLNSKEGYLFPDTYLIPNDATIDLIISLMKNNFELKYNNATNNSRSKFTKEQIVIIASMIEREAKLPNERPLIASVIENRLDLPMRLQIDATIQYALGYSQSQRNWWKKNLTVNDLKIQSPYNTYLNDGLPPTPISNPGLDSLRAAANPAKTNYLFYFTDKTGLTHFSSSLEEHDRDIQKFGL